MGVALSGMELDHLAALIAARLVAEAELEWENYPELDQHHFELLEFRVKALGRAWLDQSRALDQLRDVDSLALLERVS